MIARHGSAMSSVEVHHLLGLGQRAGVGPHACCPTLPHAAGQRVVIVLSDALQSITPRRAELFAKNSGAFG
jgi:hypothetical protein